MTNVAHIRQDDGLPALPEGKLAYLIELLAMPHLSDSQVQTEFKKFFGSPVSGDVIQNVKVAYQQEILEKKQFRLEHPELHPLSNPVVLKDLAMTVINAGLEFREVGGVRIGDDWHPITKQDLPSVMSALKFVGSLNIEDAKLKFQKEKLDKETQPDEVDNKGSGLVVNLYKGMDKKSSKTNPENG